MWMKIIFHGHSFVEIVDYRGCVLIDPFVSGNPQCDVRFEDVIGKNIQAIILTHGHDDHLGDTVDIVEVVWCPVIVSYELWQYLIHKKWLTDVSCHGCWWFVSYDHFDVKLFQAWHGWGVGDMWHGFTCVASGVILSTWGKVIYHAGDTWLFGDMKLLGELYAIDVAFLPIGDRFTMWPQDASIATSWIKPKIVVPVHYNTWAPIAVDVDDFAQWVRTRCATKVEVMRAGDVLSL